MILLSKLNNINEDSINLEANKKTSIKSNLQLRANSIQDFKNLY